MKGIIWTKSIFEEFVNIAMLNEEEVAVVKASIDNWTQTKMELELHMSKAKINRLLKRCRIKYDVAQKESDILPIRKCTVDETFRIYK